MVSYGKRLSLGTNIADRMYKVNIPSGNDVEQSLEILSKLHKQLRLHFFITIFLIHLSLVYLFLDCSHQEAQERQTSKTMLLERQAHDGEHQMNI